MSQPPPLLQTLFAEMKRRRVFRVMAVYGAASFVVLQAADLVFPMLALPEWTIRLVLGLTLLGFPLAIVLAWAFESTPEGVRRTAPARPEEIQEIVAAPASRRWPAGLLALGGMLLLFGTGWWMGGRGNEGRDFNLVSEANAAEFHALAALPFENVNGDDPNRLIAVGIHDDLLTRLSRIAALRVTSRTSVREYEDTDKPMKQIADELGVEYVLEGSVRSSGAKVRVNVSLVDAASGESLWGEQYDRDVTPENLFDIQSDISRRVVEQLEAHLTPEESVSLAAAEPVASSTAQQWYYRGIDAYNASQNGINEARDAMRRAVEIDPAYAAAWSQIAKLNSRLNWMGQDELTSARDALEKTEALAPGSVEAHLARGYYEYYGSSNFDAALSAFLAAERLAPSDAEVAASLGLILRRQGKWAESTAKMKKAVQLDPRNVTPLSFLAENLAFRGAYRDADAVVERGLTLEPASPALRGEKVTLLVSIDRNTDRAERLAVELALDPRRLEEANTLAFLAQLDRDYPRVVDMMDRMESRGVALIDAFASLGKARALFEAGDPAATDTADSVLHRLDTVSMHGTERHALRGTALAVAGRREEALREVDEGARRVRTWEDHVDPTQWAVYMVDTYGMLGELDRGIALLEDLIDRPSPNLSVALLELGYIFDPYRADPRFDELVERRKRFEAEAAKMGEAGRPWVP